MHRMLVLVALVLATSCGSKKDTDKGTGEAKTSEGGKPAPETKKPAEELFAGPNVAFPPPIAKLALEMSEADAKAAAPDLFAAKYGYEVPGYDKVEIAAQIENGRLFQIRIKLDQPIETVGAWLEKKWGKPRADKNSIGNPLLYFDSPAVGMRAVLETYASKSSMLRYSQVMSREQLLGTDPKLWGFEKAPLLGATQDDLMKAYAAYRPTPRKDDPTSIMLTFPPLTTSEYGSSADVRVKDGKVSGYTLSITSGGDADTDAAIVARLEQLYGKGKPASVDLYTDFPGPPTVKAEIRKGDSKSFGHTVWVGDTKKP